MYGTLGRVLSSSGHLIYNDIGVYTGYFKQTLDIPRLPSDFR